MLKLAVLLTLLFASTATAQSSTDSTKTTSTNQDQYTDVVLFKTGGKIVGKIISQVEGEKVVILRADGHRFEVKRNEIALITKLGGEIELQQQILAQPEQRPPRLVMLGEGRMLGGLSSGHDDVGSTELMFGFEPGYNFYVGAGTGWHNPGSFDGGWMPFFVEVRWFATNDFVAPFFYGNLGYGIGWVEGHRRSEYDGEVHGLGFGLMVTMGDGSAITFRVGQRKWDLADHPKYLQKVSRSEVSLGISF